MPKSINPIRPSPAIEMAYKRKIEALIAEMNRSTMYWISAAFRKNPPLAQDELPIRTITRTIDELRARWSKRFVEASIELAAYFSTQVRRRTDSALTHALKKGGFSIRFKMTRPMRDALGGIVHENVSLIRSIPERYLTQVEGMVARSVTTGRDLKQLTHDIQQEFGVARRRAILIARDQNNKATANLQRVRQLELGVTEAVWVHSGGGKEPRPSHMKAGRDKVVFNLKEGWYDPDEGKHILPGELINCRCVSRPVIPGFS